MRGPKQVCYTLRGEEGKIFLSLMQRTKLYDNPTLLRYTMVLAATLYQHKKAGTKIMLEKTDGTREELILL